MNQDVKALPVVAWMWLVGEDVWDICSTKGRFQPLDERFAEIPLVRQSDAESALSELRAEVGRWKLLAESYRTLCDVSTDISAVDKILVESSDQRADTAEARLERARGLLAELDSALRAGWQAGTLPASVVSGDLARSTAAFLGEGK